MARFLGDIGRSNFGQSVGDLVNYFKSKRQEEQSNVLFNEQIANTRIDRNIKEMQLEELRKSRQKISVDQLKSQIPYGFDYLQRNARAMGLIDTEGFMTMGDVNKFYKDFLSKPEINKAFGQAAYKDAQNQLKQLQSMNNAENGKDLMKQAGINPKDLPSLIQQKQNDINMLKTSIDDYDQNLELWNSYPDDFQVFLTQQGISPGMDSVTFQDKIQEVSKIYEGEQKTPTTAMAKFLQDNPDATPDEIAAFNQKLKGKGIKATLPDGTVIEVGGGQSDLTPATTTEIQKDVSGLIDQLSQMDALGKTVFTDALTMQGQVKKKALKLADWAKIDIGEGNKEFLGKSRQFIEQIEQIFNKYRKEITGAQAAIKEISMLRDSILNKKMSPTEFEYSYNRYVEQIKRSLRLKRMLLNEGISGNNLNKEMDKMFANGLDVPATEIDRRGDELKSTGLSDEQVISQLKKEGYL